MILVIGLIYVVVFCVFYASPLPIRILITLINFLAPDSIPIIDEVLMISGVISKITFVGSVGEFISEHKFLSALIAIAIVAAAVYVFLFII